MKPVITATPSEARFAAILLRGSVGELFSQAREYGYDAIEIHLRSPNDVDCDELVELTARHDLPVAALATGMAARMDGLTFTDDDPRVRQNCVSVVGEFCQMAARLDAGVILGSMNGNIGPDEERAKRRRGYHAECLSRCVETAERLGVVLLVEPLNRDECDWLNSTESALALVRRIGSGNLKYLADTYHMNVEEADIGASLRSAAEHLGHVHLVDTNRQVPSQGDLGVREILEALADVGYEGALAFECLPVPDAASAARAGLRHVRLLLAELTGEARC